MENRPILYNDPNGHEPGNMCNRGYYEYCRFIVLNNGGIIDTDHFAAGLEHGRQVVDGFSSGDPTVRVKMVGENIYSKTLHIEGLNKNSPQLFEQYLNFQREYEAKQLKDVKLIKFYEIGSVFSPEDIPSDMIGFVAGLNNMSLYESILELGGLKNGYMEKSFGGALHNPAVGSFYMGSAFKDCLIDICGEYDYQNASAKLKIPDAKGPPSGPRQYKYLNYSGKFAILNPY